MLDPIFIFASCWRSGSTLLQRLVTTSREALIWGESGGALDFMASAHSGYRQMLGDGNVEYEYGLGGNGAAQLENFVKEGKEGVKLWIPCMNPPEDDIIQSFRNFFTSVYGQAAVGLGYARWGVKEVRSGLNTARFLRIVFPEAKFVFLVRHPLKALESLKRHNWMDEHSNPNALKFFANHWARLSGEFRQADFGRLLYYENLVEHPETVGELSGYLNLDLPNDFINSKKVKGNVKNDKALTYSERMKAMRIVKAEMKMHGY